VRAIGVIHSPHTEAERTPIQPAYARGIRGSAEIFPAYADGLLDLEGFSHIHLIYYLHRAGEPRLIIQPFLEDTPHGIFATRGPNRPNPLGLSIVRLVGREDNVLHLEDVDILDGTPLLDIKPYVTRFDIREDVQDGWQAGVDEATARVRARRKYRGDPGQG
jgi:tRNA-Thr(GGU) m(6)t(6)A37 methyltransferase TsaA